MVQHAAPNHISAVLKIRGMGDIVRGGGLNICCNLSCNLTHTKITTHTHTQFCVAFVKTKENEKLKFSMSTCV